MTAAMKKALIPVLLGAEALLKSELAYTYFDLEKACPKGAPTHILLYPYDFHNLKTILKAAFSEEKSISLMLEPWSIPPEQIYRAIVDGEPENLPEVIRRPAEEAYHTLASKGDGQLAETQLDKDLYILLGETAKKAKTRQN